jgi:demethylmenaquinone methyltransferase/2-methoxy-6-polyprenyl-1,4-benzoquinol methylase
MRQHTDNQRSIQLYREHAASYDQSARFTMPLRRRTIALLNLRPGDVVLDVGAGTGLSFELLREAVGTSGRVLAFEQSPDMFALASARVARHGWQNVWLMNTAAEAVELPEMADAILFNYVHDISRTPQAVRNILRQSQPGARIAMAGMKFFPWWSGPLNLLAWYKNRPYNAHPGDLWQPWDIVASHCDAFTWQSTQLGMGYIASGNTHSLPDC